MVHISSPQWRTAEWEAAKDDVPKALASGTPAPQALLAAEAFFQALHREGIRYCHWKSNLRLPKSLRGGTDLDLLVDPDHREAFERVLAEHRIRPAQAAPGKAYPDVENWLGLDPASGRFFHLHVHYRLVLGEQFVKNYRPPLEGCLLEEARLQQGVTVPAAERELMVLSLRALLKYRDRDAVKDLLSIRSPGLPQDIREEIGYLMGQTSLERVVAVSNGTGGVVPTDVVATFLQTVERAPRHGWRLYRLRGQVRRALAPYARRPRLRASLTYFAELGRRGLQGRGAMGGSLRHRMAPSGGGFSVALVGIDGAGKSTMSHLLRDWLVWKLEARVHYLGSKECSLRTRLAYGAYRALRRLQRTMPGAAGVAEALGRWALGAHHLSVALDRLRRYRRGQREAAAGAIVLYDRFPLHPLLDGPKIDAGDGAAPDAVVRALSRLERGAYGRMRLPDRLLVLDIALEAALARKAARNPAAIAAKHRALLERVADLERHADWVTVTHIDAGRPPDDVLGQLKAVLWRAL